MTFRPRKTEVQFTEDGKYGLVDFGATANVEDQGFNRFGVGTGPLQSVSGGGGGGEEPPPGGGGGEGGGQGASCPMVWEDFITADTAASATLEEWTDLPGLSRVVAVPRKSILVLHAAVQFSGDDFNENVQSEVRARITINDVPVGPMAVWSITANALGVPGKTEKAQGQLLINTTYLVSPAVNYTIKVQIANFFAAATFTALVGTGPDANSNLLTIAFCTTQQDIEKGQPKPPAAAESNNWVRVLDFAYDELNDEIAVARIRAEFDDGIPESSQDGFGDWHGAWEETPDRAYFEVAYFSRATLSTTPPTTTLGGTVRYKKKLTDAQLAIWQDFYSVAFGVSPGSGAVAWAYSAAEAGPTAYSQKFYLTIASYGGQEFAYETWNGPNWYDSSNPYYDAGLYGAVAWGGTNDDAYLLVPTTDTTAASSSAPYKSGWRRWVRNGIGSGYSGATKGAEKSTTDITPAGGHTAVVPITLTIDGSDIRYWRFELYTTSDKRIETDLLIAPGGFTQHELGGYVPATGETLKPSWNSTVPASYIFSRQGYYDIYEESSGGTSDPDDLTLINDDYYNDTDYDGNKIALYDTASETLLFSRGIQGASQMWRDPGSGIVEQTKAWLVFAPDESAP